jgi:type IV secretory pathway protease TraF
MRCSRCEFENIPGQARCIRCGSILEAGSEVIQIYPPRMPAWRGPFRDAMRRFRGWRLVPERPPTAIGRALDKLASGNLAGLVLSIVPGLAHLLSGHFKEVWLFVLLWFIVLGAGLFFYGSGIAMVLIGLAIAIHAWIAVRDSLFKVITEFLERAGAILLVLVALAVLYWAMPRIVAPNLTGGYISLDIPAMNIHSGDYLLVRRLADVNEPLARGTLVLIRPESYRGTHREANLNPRSLMIGQIAALPGETIHVQGNAYVIDKRRLDPNSLPVPRWLQGYPPRAGLYVPPESYFVSTEYVWAEHGNVGNVDPMISNVCILKASDIRGRAFMQWWPLSRRRFIEQSHG